MRRRRIRIMKAQGYKDLWQAFSNSQKTAFLILFFLCIIAGILIPVFLPSSSMRQIELSRTYLPGELSDEDVYSPESVSFIDEVATDLARSEARESVYPYYSFSVIDSISNINTVRRYCDALRESDDGKAYQVLRDAGIYDHESVTFDFMELGKDVRNVALSILSEVMEALIRNGLFSVDDLLESEKEGYSMISYESLDEDYNIAVREISIENALTYDDVYEYAINYGFDNYRNAGDDAVILIARAAKLLIKENVKYDALTTSNLRDEASNSTVPVAIRLNEGDLIIAKDTIITEQQLRIIDQINSLRITFSPFTLIANFIFLFIILLGGVYYFATTIQYRYRVPLYTVMLLSGMLIILASSYLVMRYLLTNHQRIQVDPLLPFFILPVLFTCITNKRRIGFSVGVITAGFSMLFPTSNKYTFFLFLIVTISSVLFVRKGTNRLDVIYEALYSALISAFAMAVFSLINGYSYDILAHNILFMALNVIFTFIFVSVALPLLEKFFNLPTQFRLHELSYTDTPTLNRLSQVAQGTFNHVRNVSDMSYAAAKEIGADAELTRVGALYHDIGKAEHPEYFIENQGGKANAHDELKNNLSAAIIKSHVKLGVEKGREIGLPQEVLDIISQHHGNDIIMYFYNEAKKNSPDAGRSVREEDFRYNGDIPQTPESAIVMLADCVEAASRTLKNPNTQKYDRLIMNIIISKINHGQMAESKLTLTDLMKIKDTFIRSLVGRDHQRIEYDKE